MKKAARPRGRPRSHSCSEGIREAALALLAEVGYERLTLEAVATRAGVGKPTIYRWWSGKPALVADVLLGRLQPTASFVETGRFLADLRQQMYGVVTAFNGPEGHWLASLIVAAQADPTTAERLRVDFLQPRRRAATLFFQQAIARGDLCPDLDLEVLIDALYAPLYHRLLTRIGPLDAALVDNLIEMVMKGARRD